MKHDQKNLKKLGLTTLLKKRKLTLKQFVDEHAITTYEQLKVLCISMGLEIPCEREFASSFGLIVSNPSEGVIILEPIKVTNEKSGAWVEEPVERPTLVDLLDYELESKPQMSKKRVSRQKDKQEETVVLNETETDKNS